MNIEIPTIVELNRQAENILMRQLKVANTLRFFHQFNHGTGDYTAERHKWLDDLSLDDIIRDIESNRDKKT